jgi:glyoxylase-like metal-dependent hydrolase (beta-lactamase superfamily II)
MLARPRRKSCAPALLLAGLLLSPAADARRAQGRNVSEESYRRARQVLDAGVRALGGLEALRSIQDITLREAGKHQYVRQSTRVEPPFTVSSREETTVVDFRHARLAIDTRITLPTYYMSLSGTVINGGEGYTLDHWSKEAAPIANPSLSTFRGHFFQRFPHFVLLEALERASSLRHVGDADYRGRAQNVITYAGADGRQTSLYFDAGTNLLTKIDFLYADAVVGDGLFEIVFTGYRDAGGVKVPSGRAVYLSGEWQVQTSYAEVRINSRPPESLFGVPQNLDRVPAAPAQPLAVNRIGKDVYLAQGLGAGGRYNALFVAFDEGVVVVDAPQALIGGGVAEQLIAKIKETVPGKPIKYLVLTHHSYDHSAGARAFIAEGATVVTTPGNKSYVERLAAAPFTLAPDALARRPRQPAFEIIRDRKHVLGDANHRVELYDIGPNPAADEMVVVYVPGENILYQTDLFNPGYVNTVIPAQPSTLHFAERLAQLGLDVERIAGGHGPVATPADLRAAVEKRRAMK